VVVPASGGSEKNDPKRGDKNPLNASKPTTHTQNHLNKTNAVIHVNSRSTVFVLFKSDFDCF
jgi:hypothetical protein